MVPVFGFRMTCPASRISGGIRSVLSQTWNRSNKNNSHRPGRRRRGVFETTFRPNAFRSLSSSSRTETSSSLRMSSIYVVIQEREYGLSYAEEDVRSPGFGRVRSSCSKYAARNSSFSYGRKSVEMAYVRAFPSVHWVSGNVTVLHTAIDLSPQVGSISESISRRNLP